MHSRRDDRFNAQTFVAVAPDGMDPCDLRLQRGDAAVRGLMDAKQPMFEFAIDRKLGGFDLSTVEGRVGALRAAAPIVAEIRDQLLRPGYERVLARRLGMDPTEVRSEVERAARGASTPQQVRREAPLTDAVTGAPVVAPVTLSSLPRSPRRRRRTRRADGRPAVRPSGRSGPPQQGVGGAVPDPRSRRRARGRRRRPRPHQGRVGDRGGEQRP